MEPKNIPRKNQSILFDETATGFFIESEGPYYSEEDIDNAFYRIKYYR